MQKSYSFLLSAAEMATTETMRADETIPQDWRYIDIPAAPRISIRSSRLAARICGFSTAASAGRLHLRAIGRARIPPVRAFFGLAALFHADEGKARQRAPYALAPCRRNDASRRSARSLISTATASSTGSQTSSHERATPRFCGNDEQLRWTGFADFREGDLQHQHAMLMRRFGHLRLHAGIFNRAQRSQVAEPPIAPSPLDPREPAADRVKRRDKRYPCDICSDEANPEVFRRRPAGGNSLHFSQAEAARRFERHRRLKGGIKLQDIETAASDRKRRGFCPPTPPSRSNTGNRMTAGPTLPGRKAGTASICLRSGRTARSSSASAARSTGAGRHRDSTPRRITKTASAANPSALRIRSASAASARNSGPRP